MKKLLLVIDVQNCFINENTKFLIKKITKLIDSNEYDDILFTKFINSKESVYYNKLNYKECIDENDRKLVIKSDNVIEKNTYTAYNNDLIKYIKNNNINEIYLCGIETECCILKSAFDLFENNYNIYVLKDYCACMLGDERHNNAIEILRRNIGEKSIK
jgi:nicotinamidase-related amidase